LFCPHCRSEYRAGFTRCADCGVDLVDHLPEVRRDANTDHAGPVVVFVTGHAAEAALVKSLLKASGVQVYGFNENISRILPFMESGWIEFAVVPAQAELAQEIIAEYRAKSGESLAEADEPEQ
jgi:hypothetical protein